jgi:hypothetical protein
MYWKEIVIGALVVLYVSVVPTVLLVLILWVMSALGC